METSVSFEETRRWLRGPVVAVATPFNEDLSLDLAGAAANIEAMVERGVTTGDGALLVAAAAGEFPTMSIRERQDVIRASVRAAAGRVPVMASVQHTDVREIVNLLRFCADEGVAGVQLGPTYYYPATEDDLFRLIDLADRAASIPLMVYSTWWDGGVVLTPPLLRRLAEFEHVDAVKWSAPDSSSFAAGISAIADRLVVVDNHAIHIWGYLLGSRAFVTHVGNFWPEWAVALWHDLEGGDYEAATRRLVEFKAPWSAWAHRVGAVSGGEGPFIKAALELAGLAGGPPRPPSARATAAQIDDLRALFERSGVPMRGERVGLVTPRR
jgi:4-hydroxy-tetrahydrodipicolinate synthase